MGFKRRVKAGKRWSSGDMRWKRSVADRRQPSASDG